VAGNPKRALAHIERALAFEPAEPEFRLLHAELFGDIDEWDAAKSEAAALLQQGADVGRRIEIGYLLLRGGGLAEAQRVFEAILAGDPRQANALIGSVLTLERLNRLEAATAARAALEAQLDQAARERLQDKLLQLDARLAARHGDHAAACTRLEALLAIPGLDPTTRISFAFDLGAARLKGGQVDAAMAAFSQAHALRYEQVTAVHPALARGDGLYDVVDEPLPDPAPASLRFQDQRRDPVFVVGFPRSGTTLLEQLLDAHPDLASFDEQPFVQRLAKQLYARGETIQAALRTLDTDARQHLRDGYFAAVDAVLPTPATGSVQPVDKNPLNLLRLPLLPHEFPDARIILSVRHPCDVVLSCYMQHFGAPAFAITFRTLESCAEMYDRTFAHWLRLRDSLSLPVHALRYEDLVNATEAEARRLFSFLDLPWDDAVMRFTERARERVIGTPSYAQVIEPVNSKAVGRWTAFRHHYSERTLDLLRPWAEHFGYPRM
jgi:tetratricopeptide (TPR) repeat protein